MQMSHSDIGKMIMFISGHAFLARQGMIAGDEQFLTSECRLCDNFYDPDEGETPWHLIKTCPGVWQIRLEIFGQGYLDNSIDLSKELDKVRKFIRNPIIAQLMDPSFVY